MILNRLQGRFKTGLIASLAFALLLFASAIPTQPVEANPAPVAITEITKNIQVPFASAARTATATSDPFDVPDAEVLVCWLSVTASSGSSPTLDVKFQDTPNGTLWFDIAGASFTQVTGSTSSQIVSATRKFGRKIRAVATIGGTTPSFTFSVFFMSY